MSAFELSINRCILLSIICSNVSLFPCKLIISASILSASDVCDIFFVNLVFHLLSFLLVSKFLSLYGLQVK